ncbi:hypothetical protein HF086_013690 [Spodoptera exigua]|uniref:Uncharacterized protein n=1 Tax=Spodoptera exigua TaxID=7107 RepID=A0A922SH74_SPOEX|nr:hypothetical protein HF086_013690 [Spodoptera exigua]
MIGAVMRGMDRMVFSSLVFWLGLILIPVATLIPDVLVTVVVRTLGVSPFSPPRLVAMGAMRQASGLALLRSLRAGSRVVPAVAARAMARMPFLPRYPAVCRCEPPPPPYLTNTSHTFVPSIDITLLFVVLVVMIIHNSMFKSMTEAVRESEIKQRDPSALLTHPRHS